MSNIRVFDDRETLAEATAEQTVAALQAAIQKFGAATWVLAGGSTPLAAYKVIADKYADALDWSKVTVLIGDERIGPLDGPDNNWYGIDQIIGKLPTQKVRPHSDESAEDAAADYEMQLDALPKVAMGLPRFDVVWLGMGPDGHTLSLFPLHPSLIPTGNLVIAVHDSPKPPADRITLSLRALTGAKHVMILATGKDKQEAVTRAQGGDDSLPIALAEKVIHTYDGKVTWFLDRPATLTD